MMTKQKTLLMRHEFVTSIPERLQEQVLYVSLAYSTAVHKCACGCGNEVVTPLSPTDWYMVFDGEAVSLSPSIGNWSFPCRSHYWIEGGRIQWAPAWSAQQVAHGRARDSRRKAARYDVIETKAAKQEGVRGWRKLFSWLGD